jgi:hypothetical protein
VTVAVKGLLFDFGGVVTPSAARRMAGFCTAAGNG